MSSSANAMPVAEDPDHDGQRHQAQDRRRCREVPERPLRRTRGPQVGADHVGLGPRRFGPGLPFPGPATGIRTFYRHTMIS